jgi:hypothetical protein
VGTETEGRCLEVVLRWGGDVIDVRRLEGAGQVTLGDADDADLFAPLGGAGRKLVVLTRDEESDPWVLRFTEGMKGHIDAEGRRIPLDDAAAFFDGFAWGIPLPARSRARLEVGAFSLTVQRARRQLAPEVLATLDRGFVHSGMLTGFAFVAAFAAVMISPPAIEVDPLIAPQATKWITTVTPPARPKTQRPTTTTAGETEATRVADVTTKTTRRRGGKKKGGADKARAALAALDGLGIGARFEGSDLEGALDSIGGITAAGADLTGLMALRGDLGAVGIGSVGIGTGPRARGYYGGLEDGPGFDIGDRGDREVRVVVKAPPVVIGSLSKDLIRRVVHEHKDHVRYCYEQALQSRPGLAGRVVIGWTIGADGSVKTSRVESTTMGDAVGSCVAKRVRTWRFPEPKGGIVVVRYPFAFRRR